MVVFFFLFLWDERLLCEQRCSRSYIQDIRNIRVHSKIQRIQRIYFINVTSKACGCANYPQTYSETYLLFLGKFELIEFEMSVCKRNVLIGILFMNLTLK